MKKINLAQLASLLIARQNCVKSNNAEWKEKHEDRIEAMLENLPHGSGIDAGIKFDLEGSTRNKLVFTFGFHHLNEAGYYDGWTEHKLTIVPDLFSGFDMNISGRNRNEIKEYLYDLFNEVFSIDYNFQSSTVS